MTHRCANPHCRHPLGARRAHALFCSPACRLARWRSRARTARALARKRRCEVCREPLAARLDHRREDARFCSPRCRQAAYRARKKAAKRSAKARQRQIREQRAAEDPAPIASNIDLATAQVCPISRETAQDMVQRYDALGMPALATHCFGLYFGADLGGVAVFGPEQGENLGVWSKFGYSGRIIALQRGCCVHWAPANAASMMIRAAMRLLPARFQVVTATVDRELGEIGTVYAAAGFAFVGIMRAGGRAVVRVNGKIVSERTAGRWFGTRGARALAKLGLDATAVPRKGRYFAFLGSRAERKRNRAAIAHLIQPYPRREAAGMP
jgi:hypothetical protein